MKIQLQKDGLVVLESELFRTTSLILHTTDYILIVDPNWLPREVEYIYDLVNQFPKEIPRYLLFTHSDYDHIIGYGKFKAFAKVIASRNLVDNLDKESIIQQINDFDDSNYIARNYPIEYPKVDIIIEDEMDFQIGADEYYFYQAVGHNKDGIITYNATKKILIVGDYLSNIEFPYIYESIEAYEQTLNLLERIFLKNKVDILIIGHGDYTRELSEMLFRIEESRAYITQLKNHVYQGAEFDFEKLWNRYQFKGIMKKFHDGNVALLKKKGLRNPE